MSKNYELILIKTAFRISERSVGKTIVGRWALGWFIWEVSITLLRANLFISQSQMTLSNVTFSLPLIHFFKSNGVSITFEDCGQ